MAVKQIKPLVGPMISAGGKVLGWVLLETNNLGRAVDEFRKVLAIEPHNDSAANGLRKLGVQP